MWKLSHYSTTFFSPYSGTCRAESIEKEKNPNLFFSTRLQAQIKWTSMKYRWLYYYLTLLGSTLIKLPHLYTWVKKKKSVRDIQLLLPVVYFTSYKIFTLCICTKLQIWELCHNYAHSSSLAAVLQFPLVPVQLRCFLGTEHNKFSFSSGIFKDKNQQLNSFVLSSGS